MSNKHKYPTISFRISDYERRKIEARIKASGMLKKDYFVRSCIYNRICVVGKKETVYELVDCIKQMQKDMHLLAEEIFMEGQIKKKQSPFDCREYDEIEELQTDYIAMLTAVIDVLDGARYLWKKTNEKQIREKQNNEKQCNAKQPDA